MIGGKYLTWMSATVSFCFPPRSSLIARSRMTEPFSRYQARILWTVRRLHPEYKAMELTSKCIAMFTIAHRRSLDIGEPLVMLVRVEETKEEQGRSQCSEAQKKGTPFCSNLAGRPSEHLRHQKVVLEGVSTRPCSRATTRGRLVDESDKFGVKRRPRQLSCKRQ